MKGVEVQVNNENPPVLVEHGDGITRITLNRPERLNAVDLGLLDALAGALADAAEEGSRVAVIGGAGPALCVGADLAAGASGTQDPAAVMEAAARVIGAILEAPMPVVCAATGPSAGFGASLALASDITVMADDATLIFPFAHLGLVPDGGVSHLLPALVGRQVASRLLMLGETVDAAQSARLGIVAESVPTGELGARIDAIASTLAAAPARGMTEMKKTLVAGVRDEVSDALKREGAAQTELLASPEFRRAAAAFVARAKRG